MRGWPLAKGQESQLHAGGRTHRDLRKVPRAELTSPGTLLRHISYADCADLLWSFFSICIVASIPSRTIGFSNAIRLSSAACSSEYSLKKASTHRVETFLPLGSEISSSGGLQASVIAALTCFTSRRFPSTGSPVGTTKSQMGRIGAPIWPS